MSECRRRASNLQRGKTQITKGLSGNRALTEIVVERRLLQ
jgi:hypothetical protein